MNLSCQEFCLFNTSSRFRLLKKDGLLLNRREVGKYHSLLLFRVYNFHVEMLVNQETNEIVAIDPVRNKEGLTLYAEKPD